MSIFDVGPWANLLPQEITARAYVKQDDDNNHGNEHAAQVCVHELNPLAWPVASTRGWSSPCETRNTGSRTGSALSLRPSRRSFGPWSNFKNLPDADWVKSAAPAKKVENAYSSIDSFITFARRNLASGINLNCQSRCSPCSLQGRRRENMPRRCFGRWQNNCMSQAT